jgi:hypothetical protein
MTGWFIFGIQALHIRPKIRHAYAGGTLYMHQRQTAGRDQALNGTQGNTELFGRFALGYQQSPGHKSKGRMRPASESSTGTS